MASLDIVSCSNAVQLIPLQNAKTLYKMAIASSALNQWATPKYQSMGLAVR